MVGLFYVVGLCFGEGQVIEVLKGFWWGVGLNEVFGVAFLENR